MLLSVLQGYSQTPHKLRSSLGVSGSSSIVVLNGGQYFYQQSIGQEGTIGTNISSPLVLRQGFIQPLGIFGKVQKDIGTLKVLVYPNPVNDNVTFTFEDVIYDDILVTIYNSWGKVVGNYTFTASQKINLNLIGFSAGLYLVKVNSVNKSSIVKLIRN